VLIDEKGKPMAPSIAWFDHRSNEIMEAWKKEVDDLFRCGVESIAVVFLNSYANPVHENRAVVLISEKYPDLAVSASFEVAPEIREYERCRLRSNTSLRSFHPKPFIPTMC